MTKTKQLSAKSKPAVRAAKSNVNFEEVTKLIGLVDEKKLTHFELETEGFKIIIGRNSGAAAVPYLINSSPVQVEHGYPQASRVAADVPDFQGTDESSDEDAKGDLHYVTSPMVGTFYRAPDPSSAPFVDVGEPVKKKQTLCIVEAMKLMNEIECEVEGVVKEIYVENGKPVEFGQRLFSIRTVG